MRVEEFIQRNQMHRDRAEALTLAARAEDRLHRAARAACVVVVLACATAAAWLRAHPLVFVGCAAGYFVLAFLGRVAVVVFCVRPLLAQIDREHPSPGPLPGEEQDRILNGPKVRP